LTRSYERISEQQQWQCLYEHRLIPIRIEHDVDDDRRERKQDTRKKLQDRFMRDETTDHVYSRFRRLAVNRSMY
jgi:hypothetical protein